MKPPVRRRSLIGVVALAVFVAWIVFREPGKPTEASRVSESAAKPVPPVLLVSKAAEGGSVLAWQRFLAADGSPREDVAALQDMVATLLQSVPPERRPALGFDSDLARVLTNAEFLGDAALPATHPALRDGRLIDRWGNPWLVHPLASDVIQVRSAGPDGKFFTSDDLVAPRDAPEPESQR